MDEVQQLIDVMEIVDERSRNCPRGLLAVDEENHVGLALVAPNCLDLAYMMFPVPGAIYDFILN